MTEEDMMKRMARQMEQQLFAAIAGPPQNRRQTALRMRGNGFETVELDDVGNVIEPVRCTCGGMIVMHRPACPFYCVVT